MKNKFIKASFCLLFTVVLFSCKSENVEPRYIYLHEMSFFSGSINGQENNEKDARVAGAYGQIVFPNEKEPKYRLQYRAYIKDLHYDICGSFAPLNTGMYKITNTDIDFASQQTQIYVYKLEENNTKQQLYLPIKHAFYINVRSFERIEEKSGFLTKGEMAGILHNPDNLQDSIIIDFGRFIVGH